MLMEVICFVSLAMVTSTSTPGSMLMEVICLTISDELCRSISRLCILIWYLFHVLLPSPHGVLRVVMRSVRVGMRTGPLTLSCFSLAPRTSSEQTFSRGLTVREVRVMRILCTGSSSAIGLPLSGLAYAMFTLLIYL